MKIGRTFYWTGRAFRIRAYLPACTITGFPSVAQAAKNDIQAATLAGTVTIPDAALEVVAGRGGLCLEFYFRPDNFNPNEYQDVRRIVNQLEAAGFNQAKQ